MTGFLLILTMLAQVSAAEEPISRERAFMRALELFDRAKTPDDYRASARELEGIVADGFENGAVYYNLGNAYFRAGDYGKAIINYRKAKPLRPRDSYLEANLQQALSLAPGRLKALITPWWTHVLFWSDWFAYPQKIQLASLGMIVMAFTLVAAFILQRRRLRWIAVAVFSVSLALGIDASLSYRNTIDRAAITAETIARKGTNKDYEPAFDQPLRDGAEFTVLSQTADWTFGHFEGIGDGWVRNEFVAR